MDGRPCTVLAVSEAEGTARVAWEGGVRPRSLLSSTHCPDCRSMSVLSAGLAVSLSLVNRVSAFSPSLIGLICPLRDASSIFACPSVECWSEEACTYL